MTGRRWFWTAFAAVTLLIAGGVSYLASASPDGLDSVTRQGCEAIDTAGGEALSGDCIAQHARDHALADSPMADYTIGGHEATGGIAGIIGVLVTVAIAGGLFWLLARTRRSST